MGESQAVLDEQIAAIRGFNRFYTRQIGLLDESLLKSPFSLTEGRVLFELARRDRLTASTLCRDLGLDAGYLSRLLKKFETRGLIARAPSEHDARQTMLSLTAAGRDAFAPLDADAHDEIAALLASMTADERDRLVKAMRRVQSLLDDGPDRAVPFILRPHAPGDIGWIIHRHGVLYAEEYGWDENLEALAAEIAAAFVKSFDPKRERCWIAERDGEIVGSVFIVREDDETAKLRLLYVERAARGLGIGRRLVDEAIRFARAKGYRTLTLWTNDVLVSARRIYEAAGFQLVAEDPQHAFGKDVVSQTWSLAL